MVQVEIVIYHRHSSRSPFSVKTSKRVGCIVSSQVGSFRLLFVFFFSLLWFFGCQRFNVHPHGNSPLHLPPFPVNLCSSANSWSFLWRNRC